MPQQVSALSNGLSSILSLSCGSGANGSCSSLSRFTWANRIVEGTCGKLPVHPGGKLPCGDVDPPSWYWHLKVSLDLPLDTTHPWDRQDLQPVPPFRTKYQNFRTADRKLQMTDFSQSHFGLWNVQIHVQHHQLMQIPFCLPTQLLQHTPWCHRHAWDHLSSRRRIDGSPLKLYLEDEHLPLKTSKPTPCHEAKNGSHSTFNKPAESTTKFRQNQSNQSSLSSGILS